MALSNIEERVQRSLFEAIRKVLVEEGYLPDISNTTLFPQSSNGDLTELGANNWATAVNAITNATEVFSNGSQWEKGEKNYPRIVIEPTRIVPGDIGSNAFGGYTPDENNPEVLRKVSTDWNSSHLQHDVILTCKTAKQERLLNAIISKALGVKKFIPVYDSSTEELILVTQYGFYASFDDDKGVKERTYSYEVKDLFMNETYEEEPIARIKELTVEFIPTANSTVITGNGTILGQYISGESLVLDLSSVSF